MKKKEAGLRGKNKRAYKHPRLAKINYSNGAKKGWETRRERKAASETMHITPATQQLIEEQRDKRFEEAKQELLAVARNYCGSVSDQYNLFMAALKFAVTLNDE